MLVHSLIVAIGGSLGALARYATNTWMARHLPSVFPYATLSVNLAGSFFLGLLLGGNFAHWLILLLGTGFMGAFTTFSTFKLECVLLKEQRLWRLIWLYVVLSYGGGIVLAYFGYEVIQ
jgi:CrcB protein